MKTKLITAALALGLAAMPMALFAGAVGGGNANSSWTLYAWQNWAGEYVDDADVADIQVGSNRRSASEFRNGWDASNVGVAASIDTGLSMAGTPLKATFQCEQFSFFNEFSGTGICNRNSKFGLSGPWGEVMFSQWLTPYNEMSAQWIDPFYDAGTNTHSTNMGLMGFGTAYGNGGFDAPGMSNQGFMRRKDALWQWWSPNWNGFTARVGYSNQTVASSRTGDIQVVDINGNTKDLDPYILDAGVAYTTDLANGDNLWFFAGISTHQDWAAVDFSCRDSDDTTYRLATRYIHGWANGMTSQISVAYEEQEYDWKGCADPLGRAAVNSPFDVNNNPSGNAHFDASSWLVSGKHSFAGPWDIRAMWTMRDDYNCKGNDSQPNVITGVVQSCNGSDDSSSSADELSIGAYYTMPAGTELRVTWSDLNNDSNSLTDYGINGVGVVRGGDANIWSFGMTQWF